MPATTRRQLLADGVPRSAIDRARDAKELQPWIRGIYLLGADWDSELEAHLLRGGPGSAASHRSAVRLHDLDVRRFHYDGIDLTVPLSSPYRTRPAFRSGTLTADDIVSVRGHSVTSILRTLFDIGRVCSVDEVELAVESALRGKDPKKPAVWNEQLFADIVDRMASCRAPGSAALREVMGRRPPGARPTGTPQRRLRCRRCGATGSATSCANQRST